MPAIITREPQAPVEGERPTSTDIPSTTAFFGLAEELPISAWPISGQCLVSVSWDGVDGLKYHQRMSLSRTPRSQSVSMTSAPVPPSLPNPDYAWKALSLINEWIRHYDIKAGLTLAFTGVLATLLFNLITNVEEPSWLISASAALALLSLVSTAGLCVLTLAPRERDRDAGPEAISRLVYTSITRHYVNEGSRYGEVLCELTMDPAELTKNIAAQIHVNAAIATMKAKFVKRSVVSALGTGLGVATLAFVIGLNNI